jgi:hypothetical protein
MKIKQMLRGCRLIDYVVVLLLVFVFTFAILTQVKAKKANAFLKIVTIEIVVPNLEKEVAKSIQVGDQSVDQNGKVIFEVIEKIEKPSEHPVIDQKGNLVISKHPTLKSLFLKVNSVKQIQYTNGIKYNWQVVKIGGSLIWETKLTRFVGLVRSIIF